MHPLRFKDQQCKSMELFVQRSPTAKSVVTRAANSVDFYIEFKFEFEFSLFYKFEF